MTSLADRIMLAGGWRRRLIALVAGALGALAMAPFDLGPAMVVPMTVAIWLIDGAAPEAGGRQGRLGAVLSAFSAGWWWGFGYFVAGLWWMGAAFLVEADQFAWALPLGVIGLPAVAALYPAFGFALARALWAPGACRFFALAVGLGLSEWLRGIVLTGFPWNEYGMALGGTLVTAQAASLVGIQGLTVLTILIGAAPAALWDTPGASQRWRAPPFLAALVVVALLVGFGALRLQGGPTTFVADTMLRIMQPNLQQDADFSPENAGPILRRYLDLSTRSRGPAANDLAPFRALIWSESAFPFILSRTPEALAEIAAILPPSTVLVTGAARQEDLPARDGYRRAKFFNDIQVVAQNGTVVASYDKAHLVPFGEYLPFAALLDRLGIRQFVHIPGGFEPGDSRRILDVPGLPPVAPLVCYEAIFSGEVLPPPRPGMPAPGLMLNVTNDAWFGRTPGPYQHFAQARLRTIEEGLPLVRAGNTGISAVVDAYGRVTARLPLGTEGVLDAALPARIEPPFFAGAPRLAGWALWVFSLAAALVLRYQRN